MKYFKYQILNRSNVGTEENPVWNEVFYEKKMPYSETREEIVKVEAYNGAYTIEDDGEAEVHEPTDAERIAELEEALKMLLNGGAA